MSLFLINENRKLFAFSSSEQPGKNRWSQVSDIDFKFVSFHETHVATIDEDGNIWTRGTNKYGQLGLGDTQDRKKFNKVISEVNFVSVCCGPYFTVAIDENNDIWSCGYNHYGTLGIGGHDNKNFFTKIKSECAFKSVSCGSNFFAALDSNGDIWTCGDNWCGQLGSGDIQTRSTLTKIHSETSFVSISCGLYSLFALDYDGKIWYCGDYDEKDYLSNLCNLTQIKSDEIFTHVCCGAYHPIALNVSGDLFALRKKADTLWNNNLDSCVFVKISSHSSTQKRVSIFSSEYYHMIMNENGHFWMTDARLEKSYASEGFNNVLLPNQITKPIKIKATCC